MGDERSEEPAQAVRAPVSQQMTSHWACDNNNSKNHHNIHKGHNDSSENMIISISFNFTDLYLLIIRIIDYSNDSSNQSKQFFISTMKQ